MATSKTDLLETHKNELVKQYIEFDGQNRISKVYTAYSDAGDGMPCEVTEYIYTGPATTTLKARKEGRAVWDSAWDADFTVET